ncbi:unnamed protein product [Peronospora destructor]|uniref:BZIP domain-containing protein n=1 Tax=Peronospora destructor TaxID=86335 RepID=A0AAV0TV51_9STRA|nr:unnamed protein product [Peronospora destructor]
MLMEHHHTQGRSSWMPSLYSAATATSSMSLPFDGPLSFVYSSDDARNQSPQNQDHNCHYRYNEAVYPTLPSSLPHDNVASSFFRPMVEGSLSLNIKTSDKPSSESAIVIRTKQVPDEKRRAKHREAQRRFVSRKKIKMTQLKQLAVELEKRHCLLQAVSEQKMLTRDNCALLQQITLQKENSHVDGDKIKEEHESEWKVQTFEW